MKKVLLLTVIMLVAPLTFGCSKQSSSGTTTSSTSSDKVTLENTDTVNYEPAQRLSITDPALASYLDDKQYNTSTGDLPTISDDERDKIGSIAQITKSVKYGLSGVAQIVSKDTISLKSFSYNGACAPLLIYLTRQNQTNKPLIKVKEMSTPLSNTSLTVEIPSNMALTTFDSLGFYCPEDVTTPVSTAYFSK